MISLRACSSIGGGLIVYRIALIFRGSKFSRIAVFENFVEIISRIRSSSMPHPHFSVWGEHM